MTRAWTALIVALALAGCAGTPRKPAAPLSAGHANDPADATPGRKRSPYPPAQEDPAKRGDYVAGGLYAPGVRDSVPDELPDVDAIPEPEVVDEPRSRVGNRSTYTVLGRNYHVLDSAKGYVETGVASFYGNKFHGRRTSNLEVYDMYAFSAAHKTLPLPSFARVTNLDNGKSVIVRVNDRGPFHAGRLIDLSYAAAARLGYVRQGTARVEVRALTAGDAEPLQAGARNDPPPAAPAREAAPVDRRLAVAQADSTGHRFDMRQDGRVMTAAEFDAWMASRQVRVATGKPGTPAHGSRASGTVSAGGGRVVLQVASFSARANADRALALLQGAGIVGASLVDADADGRKVWRLRVGPLASAAASDLAARIAGLGFGPPQRVRE